MRTTKTWPYNLLDDLFLDGWKPESLPTDLNASIEYVINLLGDRISGMVFERYKQGLTLNEISGLHGISRERVRQIILSGRRKLRHPAYVQYIQYGVSGVLRMGKIAAAQTARKRVTEDRIKKLLACDTVSDGAIQRLTLLDSSIYELGLSTRARNGLIRGGCRTVADVVGLSGEQFRHLRCIGEKSRREIIEVLEELGLDCKQLKGA